MDSNEEAPGDSAAPERRTEPETVESGDGTGSSRRDLLHLSIAALGIVYGDIGTSPLYAFRESFSESHGIPLNQPNILGILSLIFWALTIVISVKYLAFILRADNQGEGGILALTALVSPLRAVHRRRGRALVLLGLFGASLLYGDGVITPAISVLSAVEGLEIVTPIFRPYVVPITIAILLLLFSVQKRGTGGIGRIFGPVTLVWFLTLAVLGLSQIWRAPVVLQAINPLHGVEFFLHNGWNGFLVLGSVFLVVTGGEALYADLGHFGIAPIRLTWFSVVFPSLLFNYFGQGALLLSQPRAIENPFFRLAPDWALMPLVALATLATVIASQAVISGAFSLTRQAIQLGYLPRMEIEQTSATSIGQIYIPGINFALMIGCVSLVLGFGSSSALAAAYGVAVTTDMVFTTVLFTTVLLARWKWGWARAIALGGLLLVVDLGFWGANIIKVPDGGWFPLLVGAAIFTMMTTWKKGREVLRDRLSARALPFDALADQLTSKRIVRVPGTAVFMYSDRRGTPPALLHNLKHNKVLHERVLLLSVESADAPHVPSEQRLELTELGNGLHRVVLRYGFMEDPNVPRELALLAGAGLDVAPGSVSYFLGRERVIASKRPGMARWREKLFGLMNRNARNATDFFRLPPNQVVEVGAQIEI